MSNSLPGVPWNTAHAPYVDGPEPGSAVGRSVDGGLDAWLQPPVLEEIKAARAVRDWPRIRWGIESLESADDRILACDEVCRPGDDAFYREVVSTSPEDALARTLLGLALLVTGWDIRGTGRAATVTAERFDQFHDHLRRADAALVEAVAREPQRGEAWTVRVTVALGLSLGLAEGRRRYLHAVRASPDPLGAQRSHLQHLLPKWQGSWEAADEFARSCVAQAPLGAPNAVLVADVHLERVLELSERGRQEYFADPQVRAEILDAARRGPLAPEFRPGLRAKNVYNTFACALALSGEYAAAAFCFRALGDHQSEYPWAYFGDPAQCFAHYRDLSLRGGNA